MNNNDFSDMLKKAQEMISNNQVPDEIKDFASKLKTNENNSHECSGVNVSDIVSNINTNASNDVSSSSSSNSISNDNLNGNGSSGSGSQFDFSNIDIGTLMKVQGMLSKLNSASDDDMSKLLFALKPYLRNEKKEKVDEYIKLIRMGKMTEFFDLLGRKK